jgi:DNA (cytosine-5)-methyltransferase 1
VASYEWWDEAARTHSANLGREVTAADIRALPLEAFPQGVDFVVGSPPCTQFSYANRGGTGDIEDGLKDIAKFLEVVQHVQPRAWAMENVPRVAGILGRELAPGGVLERFSDLVTVVEVVDASEWGVPQRRKRMLAGNFDSELLDSYRGIWPDATMGQVIVALATGNIDPVYKVPVDCLTDNVYETPLSDEEARMNCEAKTFHRVYNKMAFPDELDRPSRTVTATCTRVSRESIILETSEGRYRRLSIRERGSLQSFPASYQFLGRTHGARVKMIGNAVPPLLTFNLAHCLLGTRKASVQLPANLPQFADPVPSAPPPTSVRRFPADRRFAAAIPGLRFGSGVRFELCNKEERLGVTWGVHFYFGNSKDIREIPMDRKLLAALRRNRKLSTWVSEVEQDFSQTVGQVDQLQLQDSWCGISLRPGPYELTDALAEIALRASRSISNPEDMEAALDRILGVDRTSPDTVHRKVQRNAVTILSGLVSGSLMNVQFKSPAQPR